MATKENIIEKSLHLFLTHGFSDTTMNMIGEAVGIRKASLYAHYKSKDDIARAVMDYLLHGIEAHNLDYDAFSMKQIVYMMIESGAMHQPADQIQRHTIESLVEELLFFFPDYRKELAQGFDRIRKSLKKRISKAVANGEVKQSVNPELLSYELIVIPKGFLYVQNFSASLSKSLCKKFADEIWQRICCNRD